MHRDDERVTLPPAFVDDLRDAPLLAVLTSAIWMSVITRLSRIILSS